MSKLDELFNKYTQGKEIAEAPAEGGLQFGNIAPWGQFYTYSFRVEQPDLLPTSGKLKPKFVSQFPSGTARVYYYDSEVAREAMLELAPNRYVERVFVLSTSVDKILNWTDEIRAKFTSPHLNQETQVTTWGSKNFGGWNLVTFPSMIHAWAMRSEIDVPKLDFSEISQFDDNKWSDDFQERMIGHQDGKSYEQSVYFKQRVSLWKALGEDNPMVSSPEKTNEVLGKLMSLAYLHEVQFYAKVNSVFDPRYTEHNGTPFKNRIPVMVEVYGDDKSLATKVAESELSNRPAGNNAEYPLIPNSYADAADDFRSAANELHANGESIEGAAETLSLSVDELRPFWNSLEG